MALKKSEYDCREVFQAVIIGEPFDFQFDPITREIPKLLLPLVNTPLLDYNLDWLHRSGVEDILLYCHATFGDKIKRHCQSMVRRRNWNHFSIRVIASDDIRSVGDALRDAYAKNLIPGDFLLIRGDTIGNIDLANIMKVHKSNKEYDRKTSMTCVFMPHKRDKEVSRRNGSSTSTNSEDCHDCLRVSTLSDDRGKILQYERKKRGCGISIPTSLLKTQKRFVMSGQLRDPCITMCSQDVPGLFSDNFDCMTRDSLVKGLVTPDDLNECNIYQYVVRRGYATTLATWQDYERASMLVSSRTMTPLCPEISLTTGRQRYLQHSLTSHSYTPRSVATCRMETHKIVCGDAVELSSKSSVTRCVLGNMCRVASNVTLHTVFAGDNCTIESGCVARQCYLGNGVTLLPNTKLEPGCVVASNVTLGPDVTVPRASLLVGKPLYDTLDEFERDDEPEILSRDAYVFPRATEDEDHEAEEDEVSKLTINAEGQTLPVWGLATDDFELVVPATEEEDGDVVDHPMGGEEMKDEDELKEIEFQKEVLDSLMNGVRENTDAGKVALEINSSRYAYNIVLEVMQAIVFESVLSCYEDDTSAALKWPSAKRGLHRYLEVLKRYLRSNQDFLGSLERMVARDERCLPIAVMLLHELTQTLELVDDAFVLVWFERGGNCPQNPTFAFQKLRQTVSKFLTWLLEAEEDDEDEESDD